MKNFNKIIETLNVSRYIGIFQLSLLLIFISTGSLLANSNLKYSPVNKKPLQVSVSIHINNIYNINTIDETYQVDGYLVYRWKDEKMKFIPDSNLKQPQVYINSCAKELIEKKLWIPTCEFINVQGEEECPNFRIEISADGSIMYTERFFETFISNMDFKSFPFDSQCFKIIIEPWGYNKEKVVFTDPKFFPKLEENLNLIDKWEIDTMYAYTKEKVYEHLGYLDIESKTWSRVVFKVQAKRLSGYFVWQILFPLFIIIMASFVMFWIRDFGTQIGIGFSLMLTVVAFNFYSASILPKLPYNTFIEYVILVGYIFIFLGIIAIVINYRVNGDSKKESKYELLKWFRYLFPLIYLLTMTCLSLTFLVK